MWRMVDVLFVTITVAFFTVAWAYMIACDRV
jgi:hypothetical protein